MEENDRSEPQRGGSGFWPGFIWGGIAGALVAFLMSRDRPDVPGSAAELYERGKDVIERARSTISAAVDEGQQTSDRLREELAHTPTE